MASYKDGIAILLLCSFFVALFFCRKNGPVALQLWSRDSPVRQSVAGMCAPPRPGPPREKSALPRPAPRKSPNPAGRGGAKLIVDSDISAAQFHKRLNLSPDYENDDDNQ